MREKKLKWLSLVLMLAASIAAMNVAIAPGAVVSVSPSENVYNPGDVFTVDINIAGVTDCYSWGVKVSWERDLLVATAVTEGPFLMYQPDGTAFISVIYDDYIDVGCTTLGDWFGVSGDGTLMTITFEVMDAGTSPLEIFYSKLLDSGDPSLEISHTVTDGNFETPQVARLVKKSAWPEHHHFDVSVQQAKDGNTNQTLYSKIKNISPVGYDLHVYVAFEVVRDDGAVTTVTTDTVVVPPGTELGLTADLGPLTELDAGKYYVSASCHYSYYETYWGQWTKMKTFSFAVVA
ncbi:MAG: hypothetical protein JSV64_06715 [Candidatus Bathyarchaeota archaeon]|nr:MAG: hypothetical protein JSV64_06715 [Candidatus Bathyarchaeota archaeon]